MRFRHVMWIVALGMLALDAPGQTSSPGASQQPAQPAPKKAKKVWTNEDLAALPANSPVSSATAAPTGGGSTVAGEAVPAGESGAPAKPGALPPEKDPKVYQQKLEALRKRLEDVEAKIKTTQDAISGSKGGSNALTVTQQTEILRPEDQMAALEKERQDIRQQIEDLEAEALKNGLSPGDIR